MSKSITDYHLVLSRSSPPWLPAKTSRLAVRVASARSRTREVVVVRGAGERSRTRARSRTPGVRRGAVCRVRRGRAVRT